MKYIAKFILWIMGWTIRGGIPGKEKKAVIVAAPHTSNWDYIIGRLAYFVLGVNVKFLIKKEVFIWPIGGLIKMWGGIPVDRGRKSNLVEQMVNYFNEYETLYMVITPEGTRKRVNHWKRGFYYISQRANVPMALGYVDYKKKEGGLGPIIFPSGDYEADLKKIQDFYRDKTARHPEKFNLSRV